MWKEIDAGKSPLVSNMKISTRSVLRFEKNHLDFFLQAN
jgi:hypothetical protein